MSNVNKDILFMNEAILLAFVICANTFRGDRFAVVAAGVVAKLPHEPPLICDVTDKKRH